MKSKQAIAILIGTVVGAGIFGLPYAFVQAGWLIGLGWLLFLGVLILLLNLLYGEIILRSQGDRQLTGYASLYLGKKGKALAALALFISLYGALLAYLVKIGQFLALILNFPYPVLLSLIFFVIVTSAIFFGLKLVSQIEFFLVIFIIIFVLLLSCLGLNQLPIQLPQIPSVNLTSFFLPYGVILFALTGTAAIPEMEEILRTNHHKLKRTIIIGSLIPLAIYLLFPFSLIGLAGNEISPDAISNLDQFLSPALVKLGAGLGVLTMGTSFLILGYALKEVWFRDFKTSQTKAVALACLPPLILFLAGATNFIQILGITGALSGSLTGLLIILIYQKARRIGQKQPAYHLKVPTAILWFLALIFILGFFSPLF